MSRTDLAARLSAALSGGAPTPAVPVEDVTPIDTKRVRVAAFRDRLAQPREAPPHSRAAENPAPADVPERPVKAPPPDFLRQAMDARRDQQGRHAERLGLVTPRKDPR